MLCLSFRRRFQANLPFFVRACVAVSVVGSLALAVEASTCLIYFTAGGPLIFTTLALRVGGGSKISASVMDALSRFCGEAAGLRFHFLSDVGHLSCAFPTILADGRVRGVRT